MKKTLKTLAIATASMITTGAIAATNMENPLFIPQSGEYFSKTGIGLMYKKADHTEANRQKQHAGDAEFPVWRATEDFGYGISDRLFTYLSLGYTYNGDIERKGMHRGRLGFGYRIFEDPSDFVWDIYGEGYLGGVSPMRGKYGPNGFTYSNFSNGRWGAVAGTRLGKTWDKLTASMFVEYLQTIGNHNNEIKIEHPGLLALGFPTEISVDLKSSNETTVGLNTFYEMNNKWSFGGGFKFVEHSDNGVKSIHTPMVPLDNTTPIPALGGATQQQARQAVINQLLAETKDMDDGWHEYALSAIAAYQVTDAFQLAMVGEYTFDFSHPGSQNGTDVKAEMGMRFNVRF